MIYQTCCLGNSLSRLISAFTETKEGKKDNLTVTQYNYVVEKAQLGNAGKYQCIGTYEEQEGELTAGQTVSYDESVVILGEPFM